MQNLRARVEPHLEHFERFDRWARRTMDADLALRDREALQEALFAPILRDDEVVGAWVERDGPDERAGGFRLTEAPDVRFVELRGVPLLPGLGAAPSTIPDPRSRRRARPNIDVLIIRRVASSGRGTGTLTVTLVYVVEEPSAAE